MNITIDAKEIEARASHLEEIHKAIIEGGVPLRGYFHWSLIDNFEWARGFKKKFRLYRVDYETKERIPTKTVQLYKQVATTNALLDKKYI